MTPSPIQVTTADGFDLAATAYGRRGGPAILIAAGMAVPQSYYRHLASYFAERGFAVWTFDYRGVAASAGNPIAATLDDWAMKDLPAMIDHVAKDAASVHLIGHSLGGQVAGLASNVSRLDSIVTIVAQTGYWRLQGGMQPPWVAFLGYVLLPLLAVTTRRFPFKALRFGVDVPSGAVRQWAQWVRHPDYLFGDNSLPTERYADVRAPVLAYSIDDDNWGSARAVDNLMARYPRVERRHLQPANYGLKAIGHMGVFRPNAQAIWDEVIDWLRKDAGA